MTLVSYAGKFTKFLEEQHDGADCCSSFASGELDHDRSHNRTLEGRAQDLGNEFVSFGLPLPLAF